MTRCRTSVRHTDAMHRDVAPYRPPLWWTVLSVLAGLLVVAVGAMVTWAGHVDDSPGLGGLGLINALVGVVIVVRTLLARRLLSSAAPPSPR